MSERDDKAIARALGKYERERARQAARVQRLAELARDISLDARTLASAAPFRFWREAQGRAERASAASAAAFALLQSFAAGWEPPTDPIADASVACADSFTAGAAGKKETP